MSSDSRKPCPTCGIGEHIDISYPTEDRSLAGAVLTYSCEHYQEECRASRCKYCKKPGSPVRQVPAPVPFSDCYCDDCYDKCRDEYQAFFKAVMAKQTKE